MSTEANKTKSGDPEYAMAREIVLRTGKTNISHLQRMMRLGYNRAARLIEAMETDGIVSPADKNGVRTIINPQSAVLKNREGICHDN